MNRKLNLMVAILATLVFSNLAAAQPAQIRSNQEGGRKELPSKGPKEETVTFRRLDRKSREYSRVVADKKFLEACEIMAVDGEMFVVESGQISSGGESFAVVFNVVNETSQSPGQYKQLVYAFDGKEAFVYFNDKNENFKPTKPNGGSNQKLKWPPVWWPGSGGGSTGVGGGFSWGDWHEVATDSCHFSFICPAIHAGKMRLEERASNSNPNIKQTRWILIHCGCY